MKDKLVAIIKEHAPQVIDNWASFIQKGPAYQDRSLKELTMLCEDWFHSYVQFLDTGSVEALAFLVGSLPQLRAPQEYAPSHVQRALAGFKPAVAPVLQQDCGENTDRLTEYLSLVDECVAEVIFKVSDLWHEEMNQKLRKQRRQLEELGRKVARLAIADGLTGLHNHKYFQMMLGKEMKRSERYGSPISIILIDLDHFRTINEVYGYETGDEILQEISDLLSRSFRAVDTVARYGGEEFIALLPSTTRVGAATKAELVRAEMERHVFLSASGERIGVTVSVGVSGNDLPPFNKFEIVNEAEAALFQAKREGRNRIRVA